jgi:dTDP-glucose 4,6-dehydratase
MRILITGGLGFIGSAVVRECLNQGYSVFNLDLETYAAIAPHPNTLNIKNNYQYCSGDINNFKLMTKIFREFKPHKVINLAAETHVDNSIARPNTFINTNINGTVNLLQVALNYFNSISENEKFVFVHVSTDEVYGSLGKEGNFSENSPYNPRSPYSASKAASDHLVSAWHHTYGLPTIITNCSNNYGPFQHPEKLVPKSIMCLINGDLIPIYGSGQNIRDWLYVEDHANALIEISKKGRIGEKYLIGTENEMSNSEIITEIIECYNQITNSQLSFSNNCIFIADRLGHDFRYAINPEKITSDIGWKVRDTFSNNLYNTVNWYINNVDKFLVS